MGFVPDAEQFRPMCVYCVPFGISDTNIKNYEKNFGN